MLELLELKMKEFQHQPGGRKLKLEQLFENLKCVL